MAALVLTGCSSSSSGSAPDDSSAAPSPSSTSPASTSPASTSPAAAPTGATGTASSPSAGPTDDAEPTDVATDSPAGVRPGPDREVFVTYAAVTPASAAVEVSGFVPALVEDGGRCVLVLSHAGRPDVSVEGEAFADAQSTACALLSVPVDRLAPGTWVARLDYRSEGSSGSSADVQVVIP
ncbi:hypothetical protein [Geodermatophilus sp. URMC 63]